MKELFNQVLSNHPFAPTLLLSQALVLFVFYILSEAAKDGPQKPLRIK